MEEYYREHLPKKWRPIYDQIKAWFISGISEETDTRTLAFDGYIDGEDIMNIVRGVSSDHPELMGVGPIKSGGGTIASFEYKNGGIEVSFRDADGRSYAYSKKECESIQSETARIIEETVDSVIKKGLDEYHTILEFAKYISENYRYLETPYGHDSSGLTIGRIVCEGVSHVFKRMCDKAGIWCIVVNGKAGNSKTPSKKWGEHAWNMVRLSNGNYYHIDVTWSMTSCLTGLNNIFTNEYTPKLYRYNYAFMSDRDVSATHQTDGWMVYPHCDDDSQEFYRKNGIIIRFNDLFTKILNPEAIKALSFNGARIVFARLMDSNGRVPSAAEVKMFSLAFVRRWLNERGNPDSETYNEENGDYAYIVKEV